MSQAQEPFVPVIVESVAGTWFYHLAYRGAEGTSLCGRATMVTSLPLESWGTVTHLNERYCGTCAAESPKGEE